MSRVKDDKWWFPSAVSMNQTENIMYKISRLFWYSDSPTYSDAEF